MGCNEYPADFLRSEIPSDIKIAINGYPALYYILLYFFCNSINLWQTVLVKACKNLLFSVFKEHISYHWVLDHFLFQNWYFICSIIYMHNKGCSIDYANRLVNLYSTNLDKRDGYIFTYFYIHKKKKVLHLWNLWLPVFDRFTSFDYV